MADTDREPANQDSQQRAALFRDMLLDALHAGPATTDPASNPLSGPPPLPTE